MNFEVRQYNGDYNEYPYGYGVYLDDREVWCDEYPSELDITTIFMHFMDFVHENEETYEKIKEVLKERN